MYYLFFDSETTGKPKRYDAPMTDVDNFPRLVQLGYIVMKDGEVVKQDEFIVKPDGFTIPEEVSKIHGITQEKAEPPPPGPGPEYSRRPRRTRCCNPARE